jgi:hypothetical protein
MLVERSEIAALNCRLIVRSVQVTYVGNGKLFNCLSQIIIKGSHVIVVWEPSVFMVK